MKPRIKICCISAAQEARMAIDAGAAALGLVGPMPSGPGVIDNEMIRFIARIIPPPVHSFLLTSETDDQRIIDHHQLTQTTTIQLVDRIPQLAYASIRSALPGVKLVQVIHIRDEDSIQEALSLAGHVDALLLDSGNPHLPVKELGGTGRVHNWSVSRDIVRQSPVPVFLAGGLHAGNVQAALDQVAPFGLDLCSGVRTQGQLDPVKLEAFFRAAGY